MSDRKIRFVIPQQFQIRHFPTKEEDRESLEARHDVIYAAIARHCGLGGGCAETEEELLYGFADLLFDIQNRLHYLQFGVQPDEIQP